MNKILRILFTISLIPSSLLQAGLTVPPNDERKTSRLSMPLFLHPHDYVKLSESHTARSYLAERLEEIGLI